MNSGKKCIDCLEVKPLEEFYKRKESPDGYRNSCKACVKAAASWRYRKGGSVKRNHYSNYGLSVEEWLELRERKKQAPCEICGDVGKLVVDHDHTQESNFRGLLCHGCNTGLGFFKDNPETLRAAAVYLEENSGMPGNKSGANKIRKGR